MRKYVIVLFVSLISIILFIYLSKQNEIKEKDGKLVSGILDPYIGSWKVEEVFAFSRGWQVINNAKDELPIIGKKVEILENNKLIFGGRNYNYDEEGKVQKEELMDEWNVIYGDVDKFDTETRYIYFENETSSVGIFVLENNTILIHVNEMYETSGFFKLSKEIK